MAGPWFTVQKSEDDWQELGHVWISNGAEDCQGRVEIKVELDKTNSAFEQAITTRLNPIDISIAQSNLPVQNQSPRARSEK